MCIMRVINCAAYLQVCGRLRLPVRHDGCAHHSAVPAVVSATASNIVSTRQHHPSAQPVRSTSTVPSSFTNCNAGSVRGITKPHMPFPPPRQRRSVGVRIITSTPSAHGSCALPPSPCCSGLAQGMTRCCVLRRPPLKLTYRC